MFRQVRVEILGIVENMAYLMCPHCNERIDVFSYGGGRRTAEQMKVHFLGELPLNPEVRIGGDTGRPIVLRDGSGKETAGFLELARNTIRRIEEIGPQEGPKIEISD
jgi:ATP-binding protein involved in chromosome partitioning